MGELDEEMVYETRPGEAIVLGSTTWRITDITRDQVLVTPAPGEPGKLPFWHGDAPGRPVEVGRAVGAFLREVASAPAEEAVARLRDDYGLDALAAANLVGYVAEQVEATGSVPSDRTIVIERFRDEIGDWRVCVLSPFGGRVHVPWALAIEAGARERIGLDVATMATDDGIVIRMPDTEGGAVHGGLAALVAVEADDLEDLVVGELANSSLFASRFRECAGRALLLPRRRGGSDGVARTPLWQQRQRASDLLAVASRYGSFPILLETYRECLRDVFDVPALVGVLRDVAARRVRVVQVDTPHASPFASSLLFGYIAGYLYEGDAPLAERRAHALSLDRERLAELLGSGELRELIDADALADLELALQRLAPERHARDADGVHDLLREVGDLASHEVAARTDGPEARWLAALETQRRAYRLRVVGEERWAAAEDAARFRDGLGVPPPPGLPEAFGQPVDRPLVDLVARYARTHGPFRSADVGGRLGLPPDAVELACKELEREGRLVAGEFRPGGVGQEWCDAGVLRRLRRMSLAALRREVEAVEPTSLGRFLPAWQGVRARQGPAGVEGTLEVVEQLQGAPIPASVLEPDVLACRLRGYQPGWLDELAASGEVVWVGRGPLGSQDGRLSLYLRDQAPLLAPLPDTGEGWSGSHAAILGHLGGRGASFWPGIYQAAGGGPEQEVLDALWDLVWAGLVTNDAFAALRALVGTVPRRARGGRRRRPGVAARTGPPAAAGRWSLVAELTAATPSATDRAAALAARLLDRHGVLVRDAVAAEEVPGGFSAVYGVLKAMEESGRVRRGYFVEGLGGAQFALPGAVDRLRAVRDAGVDADAPVVLAATDPANPYGAALAWPPPLGAHRHVPRRVAGAHVVLAEGRPVLYVQKGGRSLLSFTDEARHLAAAAAALGGLVDAGRIDQLRLQRVDGAPPGDQPPVAHLRVAGFRDHPQGLVRRRVKRPAER